MAGSWEENPRAQKLFLGRAKVFSTYADVNEESCEAPDYRVNARR
jgi:hypothetical protein